jgi:hypothetical protein
VRGQSAHLSLGLERKRRSSSSSRYQAASISGDEDEDQDDEDDDEDDDDDEDPDDDSYEGDSESASLRDRGASDVGDSPGASCAVLIVSFIHSISSPSFTVRSLYDTKVSEASVSKSVISFSCHRPMGLLRPFLQQTLH